VKKRVKRGLLVLLMVLVTSTAWAQSPADMVTNIHPDKTIWCFGWYHDGIANICTTNQMIVKSKYLEPYMDQLLRIWKSEPWEYNRARSIAYIEKHRNKKE